ncbi:uncharacterized protein LOC130189747 isoform X2 [Pseudoliparis swirei]|uniref:uncharacterized protein LOC130189747 isoform X2 n=1 Tax=Pseudoliparis swirei TaxID=2059687 RepID=UPI0024BDA402|nr:uncharacterized protein LOC130189747 isoform X2 [Pseudoliparis swirei]
MTAFPVILVQPTCPGGQRAKGVQFQLTCHLYRESHKLEVWLCFLILSFLSTSTCAAPEPETFQLLKCLKFEGLKNAIEKSEAMLYAPSSSDIKVDCPPCEAYSLKNIKVFLKRLMRLLQEMNSRKA